MTPFIFYTKHIVWVCGGRDTEEVIIKHSWWDNRRKIVHKPSLAVRGKAEWGEDLDAGLEASIDICTQGQGIRTGWQEIYRMLGL
jgi:hypothetical protein